MFKSIMYLKTGNEIQRRAYQTIIELNLLIDLKKYTPTLCGTIPISLDVSGSDIDIIMEVHDFELFKEEINLLYGRLKGFTLEEQYVRNEPTIISNFQFGDFDFELFAQSTEIEKQNAYRHMQIEHHLLIKNPQLRKEIIFLKENGMKTEHAFAKMLGLTGDPYDELLILGKK